MHFPVLSISMIFFDLSHPKFPSFARDSDLQQHGHGTCAHGVVNINASDVNRGSLPNSFNEFDLRYINEVDVNKCTLCNEHTIFYKF